MKILNKQPRKQEEAINIENYPYGYTQRTTIRYWIERTKRGERFCSQTKNPKTGNWNKPKKSTYSNIMLMAEKNNGHITYVCLGFYSKDEAENFQNNYGSFLDDSQKKELNNILGMHDVMSHVKFEMVTRKFKHRITGEITEQVPIMQMSEYFEIDEEGHPVDENKQEEERKATNRAINKAAILSAASRSGSVASAIETFKRS